MKFLLTEVVDKIEPDDVRQAAFGAIDTLTKTVDVLADDDPKNAEQVTAVWLEYVNKDIVALAESQFDKAIFKIEDVNVREVLLSLKHPLLDTVRALSDGDTANLNQLKALWIDYIKDPVSQTKLIENGLVPILNTVIKNPSIVEAIAAIVKYLLAQIKW